MNQQHLTLKDIFDACQEVELRVAKIYAKLALLLGSVDDRVERFWGTMSAEEWQHHVLVDFGRNLCEQAFDINMQITDLPTSISIDAIDRIRNGLVEHEHRLAEMNLTLNDAFKMAIEIERSEADQLFIYLTKQIEKAVQETGKTFLLGRLNRIGKEMQHHHKALVVATKRFSNDPDIVRSALSLS